MIARITYTPARVERHQLTRKLAKPYRSNIHQTCAADAPLDSNGTNPALKVSRSLSNAQLHVSQSFADLEHRLGSLLSAEPGEAQEGNEWMPTGGNTNSHG